MAAPFLAGRIVIADWRGDALPKEPNKPRPVVEDDGLFGPAYPNVVLVPPTGDAGLAIPDLSLAIEPTPANGRAERCHALSHCVATTSKARLRPTRSAITPEQPGTNRRQVALAIGLG